MSDNEIKVLLTAEQAQLQAGMEAGAASVAQGADAMQASIAEAAASMSAAQADMTASIAADAEAFNAGVQAKIEAQIRLNAAFASGIGSTATIADAESALDAAMASGAITATEYAGFIERLNAAELGNAGATEAATAAITENTAAMAINGGVARELGVLTGEALRGNWTRLEGSSITLANRMNLLQYAFSPIGLAAIAAGAAVVGFGAEIIKGAEQSIEFNKALEQTGGYLGVTEGEFNSMAGEIQSSETTIGTAREAMMKLAQSGKIGGEALETAGKAAVDFAALTGESIDQAVDAVLKIQEKPVEALRKLNEQYHFLTLAQLEHIEKLQDEGRATDAASEAITLFQQNNTSRLEKANEDVGVVIGSWRTLKAAISDAGDAIASIGRGDDKQLENQLANARARKAALMQETQGDPGLEMIGMGGGASAEENTQKNAAEIASWDKVIATLEKAQATEKATAESIHNRQLVQDSGIAAQKEDDALLKGMHSVSAYNDALEKELALKKAIHAANPNDERVKGITFDDKGDAVGGDGLAKIEAYLHKKYDVKAAAHQSEHKLDEAELAKLEADEGISYDQRLKFELDFWEKKMDAAKKGSTEYANAFHQVQTLQKDLDRESAQQADKAAKEAQQSAQQQAQAAITDAQSQFDIKRQQIETAFALGNSSRQQEIAAMQAANDAEYQLEMQAFANELKILDAKSKAAEEVEKKILDLQKRYNLEAMKSTDDAAKANLASWQKYLAPVNRAFQQSINGMIQGTQTFKQGLDNILQSILGSYLNLGIQMLTDWTSKELAKTTATTTATAARATAEQTQRGVNTAADIAASMASVVRATGVAGAQGTASFAGAPWPIDMGAPAFGAAMAASAASYGSIASAAGGWERVPIDGAMTELHKDEMVLPAHVANPIRDMAKNGGGQGGGGNSYHFHSFDSRGIFDYARRRPDDFAKAMKHVARRGHLS